MTIILGEAGIGKTTLAEALASMATNRGLAVHRGRCTEVESPAYWPWTQVFRGLEADGEAPLTREFDGACAALFAALVEVLEGATAANPALILLEDVHWADTASLALLRFVVTVVPAMPLLLVLTARDEPLELERAESAGLGSLPTGLVRLKLHGLNRQATAAVVEGVLGDIAPVELVDQIAERTGGNPFFITEMARLHALRGSRAPIDVPPGSTR